MIDALFVDRWVIFFITAPFAVLQLWWIWPLCTWLLSQIPLSGTPSHQDWSHLRPWYTHTQRDRSHSTYYWHRHGRHFSQSKSCHHSHCDRRSNSSRSYCSGSCHPLADGHTHHHLCHDTTHRHSCTPSCTCHFSHQCQSWHYSTDQSHFHSSNSHCTAQGAQLMRKAKPHPRPSTPINATIQDLPSDSSSDSDNDWFFKLLEPSPSSDEDEWGRQSSSTHYTIGLVSDCPTVTVHAGKRFKDLINSGAAISLAHTSVYNMIKDCYKTKILPAVVHLKTADGSLMSSLGKATLHLHIANFKFSYTFIICDKLPETDILLSIDLQERYSLLYRVDSDKQL